MFVLLLHTRAPLAMIARKLLYVENFERTARTSTSCLDKTSITPLWFGAVTAGLTPTLCASSALYVSVSRGDAVLPTKPPSCSILWGLSQWRFGRAWRIRSSAVGQLSTTRSIGGTTADRAAVLFLCLPSCCVLARSTFNSRDTHTATRLRSPPRPASCPCRCCRCSWRRCWCVRLTLSCLRPHRRFSLTFIVHL